MPRAGYEPGGRIERERPYFFLVVFFAVVFFAVVFLAAFFIAMFASPPFLDRNVKGANFVVNDFLWWQFVFSR